jgi:hypothetical protein
MRDVVKIAGAIGVGQPDWVFGPEGVEGDR